MVFMSGCVAVSNSAVMLMSECWCVAVGDGAMMLTYE